MGNILQQERRTPVEPSTEIKYWRCEEDFYRFYKRRVQMDPGAPKSPDYDAKLQKYREDRTIVVEHLQNVKMSHRLGELGGIDDAESFKILKEQSRTEVVEELRKKYPRYDEF